MLSIRCSILYNTSHRSDSAHGSEVQWCFGDLSDHITMHIQPVTGPWGGYCCSPFHTWETSTSLLAKLSWVLFYLIQSSPVVPFEICFVMKLLVNRYSSFVELKKKCSVLVQRALNSLSWEIPPIPLQQGRPWSCWCGVILAWEH